MAIFGSSRDDDRHEIAREDEDGDDESDQAEGDADGKPEAEEARVALGSAFDARVETGGRDGHEAEMEDDVALGEGSRHDTARREVGKLDESKGTHPCRNREVQKAHEVRRAECLLFGSLRASARSYPRSLLLRKHVSARQHGRRFRLGIKECQARGRSELRPG
jgi:hypothetical protein